MRTKRERRGNPIDAASLGIVRESLRESERGVAEEQCDSRLVPDEPYKKGLENADPARHSTEYQQGP